MTDWGRPVQVEVVPRPVEILDLESGVSDWGELLLDGHAGSKEAEVMARGLGENLATFIVLHRTLQREAKSGRPVCLWWPNNQLGLQPGGAIT